MLPYPKVCYVREVCYVMCHVTFTHHVVILLLVCT